MSNEKYRMRIIVSVVILGLMLGCSKQEESIRLPSFETPIITGYVERNEQAQPTRNIGISNWGI
ncbi:MAG: hypothetical protein ACI81Y_000451 [Glaciecola sp.]|jgi:hypothetical protein